MLYNTNLRKSRRQPSGKSAALSRFLRCVVDDDFRESYKSYFLIFTIPFKQMVVTQHPQAVL